MSPSERPLPFAVLLDLAARKAVVVGGSAAAAATASSLACHGASVTVITPSPCDELARLEDDGLLALLRRGYVRGDLAGAFLAVAESGSHETDAAVAEEARERNVLVRVAGGEGSSFTIPAADGSADVG